ncbi:MAG TPA: bi-domain-containing oxidoreductase [Bryobacteraceae bacterium]|nr:bi-domain-containing oxidoreductase [Bryobacteraceae bacterium]
MKQIVQSLENGSVCATEVPCPAASANSILIRNAASVISSGTERMLIEFGKASWIGKARQQPERLRLVLDKVKTDGLVSTIESVRSKLSQPIPLGYSSAGVVLAVGSQVTGFEPGDRVVSNSPHAETAAVPKNLCARIPEGVSFEAAAFTVLGSIALEGIRLAEPTLGESVAVIGLGLIGLLTVQLLRANGCRVLAIDFDRARLKLAEQFGAASVDLSAGADPIHSADRFSKGKGLDAVLITAATKSNEPVHQAAAMSRKRGRIVLVGVTGLELSRDDFYKKELSFQVSCSYGPGRYEPGYEQHGVDYPHSYVRWTAQRNFEAVLEMLASGRLDVEPLITHRFPFGEAERAYELIGSREPHLGVVLEYPPPSDKPDAPLRARTISFGAVQPRSHLCPAVALIGAGAYASKILIPAFRSAGAELDLIVSTGGLSAAHWGRASGFRRASTDCEALFHDSAIDIVAIATRHDSHARYVLQALETGKDVFVEKPLALCSEEIDEIKSQYQRCLENGQAPRLMIGFNRRFAPQVVKMKSLLDGIGQPQTIVITVNAGDIPPDHWTRDLSAGGGRIVGEACHFVDLARFLAGARIESACAVRPRDRSGAGAETVSFSLTFEDGSIATVHYLTSGHKRFPKERIEVFCAGRILQLNNYRTLIGWGWPGFHTLRLWRQDKGAAAMASAFIKAVRCGDPSPIPFDEIIEVSRLTLEIASL